MGLPSDTAEREAAGIPERASYVAWAYPLPGVEEVDSVSRDSISLYQCEMPEQTLAKIKVS